MPKKPKPKPVPRLGPPTNLRPAGVHKEKGRESRAEVKAALRKADAAFDVSPAAAATTPGRTRPAESSLR